LELAEINLQGMDADQAKMDFYVNVMLPKVCGHKAFGPGIRHHVGPSYLKRQPRDGKPEGSDLSVVVPSDEAFVTAIFKNDIDKWKYTWKCKQKKEKPNFQPPTPMQKVGRGSLMAGLRLVGPRSGS
jgi:hypothetical protein